MSLVHFHYDPFTEFERLFDDAFSARFRPSDVSRAVEGGSRVATFRPKMDLIENKDSNEVTALFDLPGVERGDVKIDVQQNRLIISGEMKAEETRQDGDYVVRERTYGNFSRTLQLPMGTKPEEVKAKMEKGVLAVTFPKVGKEQEPKTVQIQ
ncbi:small heat shock protein [Suillus clintonianus]|uniref:small heat shock protein n=1 Tax=Suillus clintonianus TaxID=1904413 RepID=UPI001B873A15|nr:small heat shock protein [Suillus clintonianus]KAG2121869.1 small heat shock protein [Suillus clintonianus]